VGVYSHEDSPDEVSTVTTDNTESCENGNAWAIAECANSEWNGERTKNVGSDLDSLLALDHAFCL
jgi:hypothetical protein